MSEADSMVEQWCYLCGKGIESGAMVSGDHRVPSALLVRKQPKVKGRDYAGKAPTHPACNNRFLAENHCAAALKLLPLLLNPECASFIPLPGKPETRFLALNSTYFKDLTPQEKRLLNFVDLRESPVGDIRSGSAFAGKAPVADPISGAVKAILSVLAKSSAALLVERHLREIPPLWRIHAMPYTGATDHLDFDEIYGTTVPFDDGVKAWIKCLPSGDFSVSYRAGEVVAFFIFEFSGHDHLVRQILQRFGDTTSWMFESHQLMDLANSPWQLSG